MKDNTQRVKLQLTSDLEDVPRLSGVILQEALIDIGLLQALVQQISNNLKIINFSLEEDITKLKNELHRMDSIRVLLGKIDSRVGDVASITGGLHEAVTKLPEEQEKAVKDDNVTTG